MFSSCELNGVNFSLPDELSYQIMENLPICELIKMAGVNHDSFNAVKGVIITKPLIQLIQFVILNPSKAFLFLEWLRNNRVFFHLFSKNSDAEIWKTIFNMLTVSDVHLLNEHMLTGMIEKTSQAESISKHLKRKLILHLRIMRQNLSRPFFFTYLPKVADEPLYLSLPHVNFTFLHAKNLSFPFANLMNAIFDFVCLKESHFVSANMMNNRFTEAFFLSCDLSNSNLTAADFLRAHLKLSNFTKSLLTNAKCNYGRVFFCDFSAIYAEQLTFIGSTFVSCSFQEAELHNVNFSHSKVLDCDFTLATILGGNFWAANLRGVKFIQAKLYQVDFSSCVQTGVCSGLNFYLANLSYCNFSTQDLSGAEFRGTKLIAVDFQNTKLIGVDFFGAKIVSCNFNNCFLPGFQCENNLFSVDAEGFKAIKENDQKLLNLSTILILEIFYTKLKLKEKMPAANRLRRLIDGIHSNLSDPLHITIECWQLTLGHTDSSFFALNSLPKKLNNLLDAIYAASVNQYLSKWNLAS